MPSPEAEARREIDRQLAACGWAVQDFGRLNLSAAPGVAVREFRLQTGPVDYLLYVDGKVIGVVEAKPEGHTLSGVEIQSDRYTKGLADLVPAHRRPIPFAYESTGTETQFTNGLEPDARSREVFTFHRPEELIRLVGLDAQLRGALRDMPPLDAGRLWAVQEKAIRSLERSLAASRPRALIQMATGSGKTVTACSSVYRLIKFAKAKRVLFLVDRNNLGKQALNEFQQYQSPYTSYTFTEEFPVQHLRRNTIDAASKVVITTIQRLYSILKGEEEFDAENEESSLFEMESPLAHKEALPVVYNPKIPIETFDFIVVDECHRSIYNVWRQVLDYFDAFLIGLTATPTPQTVGFFRGNVVQDYSHERAVADGVNVGYDVYRIRTRISSQGAELAADPEMLVPHRDKLTRQRRLKALEDDLTYTANQLDRDVVAEDQLRLVVRTFRDKLFTEIFPGRTEVPKTLVFAKQDTHAEDIVRVIREEFHKGNDFCQKITSKTTGKKPEELLNEFRNSYNPRIAVTVDMIATGTDVKAIECLLFLRNINSATYFEQMKGRGVRVIGSDDLMGVTPDARNKTHFVIVDAVGVCENDRTYSQPLDRKPGVSLEKILQMVGTGIVHPDVVSTLGARLARLDRELDEAQQREIAKHAKGAAVAKLAGDLIASIDPDAVRERAIAMHALPTGQEPSEPQLAAAEHERMSEALRPFHNPELRDAIVNIKRSLEQVIDEVSRDELLEASFDEAAREKARSLVSDFRRFVEDRKDEIEALQILYDRPHRAGLRYGQVKELATALQRPPLLLVDRAGERLWNAYEAVEPDKVKGKGGSALVDLVALVRHAILPEDPLVPVADVVEERYRRWLEEKKAAGVVFSTEQLKWLDAIKNHIAMSLAIEVEDFDSIPFNQMGGLGRAHQVFGGQLRPLIEELNQRLAA